MLIDELINLDSRDNKCLYRHLRVIIAVKLLLAAALLPVAWTLLTEVAYSLDTAFSPTLDFEEHLAPVFKIVFHAAVFFIASLLLLLCVGALVPFLGEALAQPLFVYLIISVLTFIGVLIDILIVIPRIFIAATLDLLLFRRLATTSTPPTGYARRKSKSS